jgi:branched-chain amino acid transport system ATP-binding protein
MPLLEVVDVSAGYSTVPVLFSADLTVGEAEIVTVLGTNGAGKTTLLRTVAGLLPSSAGAVSFGGRSITGLPAEAVARLGIQLIPEGGGVLRALSVVENLRLAGWRAGAGRRRVELARLARAFDLFPELGPRRHQPAGSLSGGERQMLALAQTTMTDARLLLIDEASLGLAPVVVARLFEIIAARRDEGRSVVLVEQNAHRAAAVADRVHVMEKGRLGPPRDPGGVNAGSLDDLYGRGATRREGNGAVRRRFTTGQ